MELYFLKSAACLAILLLFYKLLLEKEDMHVFNRFYLLFSVVISFLVPFITFTSYIDVPAESIVYSTGETSMLPPPPPPVYSTPIWQTVLWGLYFGGVLFFGIKFINNLRELALKIRNNIRLKDSAYTKVLLKEEVVPHTFLDYIFLNKKKFEENRIPREVFEHEQAHADQKHSYDILFMELLQVILWFHPLLYLAKNAIKLNHEFLADKSVLKKGTPAGEYQQMLLAFSSGASHGSLAHPINYSFIKKRFTVMKTQTSKFAIWARSLLILPLATLLLYGFSTKEVVEREIANFSQTEGPLQEKATPEMIEEYNKLAKYYNSLSGDHIVIRMADINRMKYIYNLMTEEQKKKAEPLPGIYPPPPPTPPAPKVVIGYPEASGPPVPPAPETDLEIPGPPPTPKVVIGYPEASAPPVPETELVIPGPPPPPPSPLEHIKELAAQGARFFISGKGEISAKEAIKLVENEKNLSIKVTDYGSESTVFITVENSSENFKIRHQTKLR